MFPRIAAALSLILLVIGLSAARGALRYAENFEITDRGTHKILEVRNAFRNASTVYRYALVSRGAELPELPEDCLVIRTPVQRIVAMETVTVGYLEALDSLEAIIGTASAGFITNPVVRQRMDQGAIAKLQHGQAIDIEQLLLLQPDLIITTALGDSGYDIPPKLKRTGLPVVISADYMEQHPLARAEWLKFMAALLEKDPLADTVFQDIEARYHRLKALTEDVADKPTVLSNAPYSGVWHVPGGQSFTAHTIRDAGGDYLWSEDQSQGGIPLDIERVFLRAARADFWINPGAHRSTDALLSVDQRFTKFRAARQGRIYNNTRQAAINGGNAIWERGIVDPDQVLADLIHIFHPTLLPDHNLVYYEKLH